MKIKPMHDRFQVPHYATDGAAGFDVRAHIDEPVTIAPGEVIKIPLGFAAAVPYGHVALLAPRSGMASKERIILANIIGVIDYDYRGQWIAVLTNVNESGSRPVIISPMDRIAQCVVVPINRVEFDVVDELPDTVRGAGGFGHSGKE